jgi:pyruvate/2-oxoglutarate dehydrogenase complex dihydrolipoamide dehydrogenase (E3) component
METNHFKYVVIGSGSGGLTIAIGLANLGKQVALIEANHVGGDCTNVGCIPSKTLINLAKEFRRGDDVNAVLREVIKKRDALRDKETEEIQNFPNIQFIQGHASFSGEKELIVVEPDGNEQQIKAENIIIATGARPRLLQIPGLPQEKTLTNESIFDIAQLPRHLVIMGAGIIAVELAVAFRKLGSKVTLIALDGRVLPTYPTEVSEAMQPELEKQGIKLHLGATSDHYEAETQTLYARKQENIFPIEDVDQVLIAIGRIRNIDNLGLENTGVAYNHNGINVDTFGRTNINGIYAIGDVTPTSAFTHSANAQGRRLVQKIVYPFLPASRKEPIFPTATFSDPEIATTGMTPSQIEEKFDANLVMRLRCDLKDIDRGYTDNIVNGFVMVDVMRLTGKILGATIVAPHASEMISFFTLAINQRVSMYKLFRQVYPYPTYSNSFQKIADDFMKDTLSHFTREIKTFLRFGILPKRGKKTVV